MRMSISTRYDPERRDDVLLVDSLEKGYEYLLLFKNGSYYLQKAK